MAIARALVLVVVVAHMPQLAAQTVNFDISAQPLPAALRELAEQSGVQIYYPQSAVADISSEALYGTYSVADALDRLLGPANLRYTFADYRTIVIQGVAAAKVVEDSEHADTRLDAEREGQGTADESSGLESGAAAWQMEEVMVTGSLLYPLENSPSPVTVVARQDLIVNAPTNIASFFFDNLVESRVESPAATQDKLRNPNNNRGHRTTSIDLRGVGAENTLVLLNGRRVVAHAVPDRGGWSVANVNQIAPLIALQRVELLLDGGSATFGSDPTGGVVNMITRDDFVGLDVSLDSRFFEGQPDAKNFTLGTLFGAGGDESHVIAALEWHEEDHVFLNELTSRFDGPVDVTPETGTGLLANPYLTYEGVGGRPTWMDPDCGNSALGSPATARIPAYEDTSAVIREADAQNPAEFCAEPVGSAPTDSVGVDHSHLMGFVRARTEVAGVRFGLEVAASRLRFRDVEYWGDSNGDDWTVPPRKLGREFALPENHPGLLRAQQLDPTFGLDALGNPEDVYIRGEVQPFLSTLTASHESDLWRIALDLSGDFNEAWSWRLDGVMGYNQVKAAARDAVTRRVALALNGLGGEACGYSYTDLIVAQTDPMLAAELAAAAGQGSCGWYNPFMSAALPNSEALGLAVDGDLLEWMTPLRIETHKSDLVSMDYLVSGEVGELPGGPLGVAVGVHFREEGIEKIADSLQRAGAYTSLGFGTSWTGSQDVSALYAEVALPVHDKVDIQMAVRREDYEDTFSETTPKIAALWRPTENLRVRASLGTSFKAPSITHLQGVDLVAAMHGGATSVTRDGVDYGCTMCNTLFTLETNANPLARPQTAKNASIGFDWDVTDSAAVGASLVRLEIDDKLVLPNGPTVSRACYLRDENGVPVHGDGTTVAPGLDNDFLEYAMLGQPGSAAPLVPPQCVSQLIDPTLPAISPNVKRMVGVTQNVAFLNMEVLDLRAAFDWHTTIGRITFQPNASVFLKYDYPQGPFGGGFYQCPGGICDGVGVAQEFDQYAHLAPVPHWSGNFPVELEAGNQRWRVTVRFRGAVNEVFADLGALSREAYQEEKGMWTVDLAWGRRTRWGSFVSAQIVNLFDNQSPATSPTFYDRGRRQFTLQLRHSFGLSQLNRP